MSFGDIASNSNEVFLNFFLIVMWEMKSVEARELWIFNKDCKMSYKHFTVHGTTFNPWYWFILTFEMPNLEIKLGVQWPWINYLCLQVLWLQKMPCFQSSHFWEMVQLHSMKLWTIVSRFILFKQRMTFTGSLNNKKLLHN